MNQCQGMHTCEDMIIPQQNLFLPTEYIYINNHRPVCQSKPE